MSSDSARRLYARALLAVAQLASLFAFAGPLEAIRGFPLDDAWIHQVVARTFATSGTLGYAPGHHGAGATSYLWAGLLAIDYRIVHADPFVYTLALNVVFTLALGQCLFGLLADSACEVTPGWIGDARALGVTALAMLGGNVLWFAYSGMEATCVACLAVATIANAARDPNDPRAMRFVAGGLCAGALALTRPEAALLGPVVAAWLFARRARPAGAIFLAPWAAMLALYVGSNLVATGTALPATLAGRKWLWLNSVGGLSLPQLVLDFTETWGMRLRDYTLGTSSNVAFWVSLGLCARGLAVIVRRGSSGARLLVLWTLVHVAVFVVLMPSPGHGGRYQPLVPVMYLALLGLGSVELVRDVAAAIARLARRHAGALVQGVATVAALAPWAALVAVGVRDWRRDHVMAVTHIRATELALGPLVDELPPSAKVASYDIGGVGFAAHRPILDAGGLSDRRSATLMKEGRIWELLRDEKVEYLILPTSYRADLPLLENFGYRLALVDNPAIRLEPMRVLESPRDVWTPSIRATWNAAPGQTLHRVTYTGAPAFRPSSAHAPARPVDDPDRLLPWRDRARLDDALEVIAGNGVTVLLRASRERTPMEDEGPDFAVALGPWGVDVRVPYRAAVYGDEAKARFARATAPYVDADDFGGALLVALHVAADITRVRRPEFHPQLPLPSEPTRGGATNDLERTFSYGVWLVLGVMLIACGASRLREARVRLPSKPLKEREATR